MHAPQVVRSVSELIGHTPLFELARGTTGARLLLKLEQFNPTGTAKIRMARQMVRAAEEEGRLRPGGHIVESTSGNTGLGLAVVAAERGYRFTAVVDHHACKDKLRAMRAMGADLVFVGESGDENLATAAREDLAARIAKDENAVFTEQHNNPANAAGYEPVAEELLAALPGGIDMLIGPVGTGGSLCGTGRRLRRAGSGVRVVGVEPEGSIAFGGPAHDYFQSGTGTPEGAEIGELVDFELIDEGVKVSDRQAFATARAVALRRGLLIGGSSGGVVHEALRRLLDARSGATLVAFVNDGGEKYLDTVFDDDWMTTRGLLDTSTQKRVDTLLDLMKVPS